MTQPPIDRGITWSIPNMDNLRFMRARYVQHSFKPHAHDYYVLGIIEAGLQTFDYGRKQLTTEPGNLILINPEELHTGEAAIPDGFVYRALYPTRGLMQSIAQEFETNASSLPVFNGGITDDPQLYRWFQQIHHQSEGAQSQLEIEDQMTQFLVELVRRYGEPHYQLKSYHTAHEAIKIARDYVEANYASGVSLDDLAEQVHISPYHFARLFRKHVGVPPHKFLENVRIRHAENLLLADNSISDVAYQTGFSSQSHLSRTFKRVIGTTPGEYIKQRKIM